jgi:hypothetical protein
MAGRRDELAQERAISAARPAALLREIEDAESIRTRLGRNWRRPKPRSPVPMPPPRPPTRR